jgi:membrane-bound ClpP family serine protease
MGVAALVLGIVGVALCWVPLLGWGGVGLALIAMALAIVALKRGRKGTGLAGLVLGIVGLLWGGYEQLRFRSLTDDLAEPLPAGELEVGLRDAGLDLEVQTALEQALRSAEQARQDASP